jgi:CheY-like chemotaxis protein/HPt (histidine-containing phosphotransfer) domain-containing protein
LSKIEAGKLELELLNMDLPAVLDDFAALLAVRAQDKGLEFICAAAPDVPAALCGDPGRLRQILLNLAGNALKFTRQGEVVVRTSLVSETAADALLRFSVQDTGIGIPAEKQELLFQKFSQADVSTTRQFGGTGLGLAISKQLAELMGGEIGVRSEAGCGSEFWFTVRLGKQAAGTPTASLSATHLRGTRVLVVDDNATQREVLLTQLTAWGLRAEAAPDGPLALRALLHAQVAGDPIRVALLDLQMPGMDGAALAQAIRADTTLRTPRLVLMTAVSQRNNAQRLEENGFTAYLSKPVRQSELHDCLATVLAETGTVPAARSRVTRYAGHTLRELRRGGPRILLAEDNIVNQQVAQGILKKLGLRADTVANGLEVLQALATLPYDLVLMDVQMPELDGLEATRRIRDSQSPLPNHHLPIIAMTANAMQGDRECCLAAGMNDYITKPLVPQALADVLDKWLPPDSPATADEPPTPAVEPAAVSAPELPVFDKAGMLARLMDDEGLACKIVELFLKNTPRQIETLRVFLEVGDGPGAACQAHSIKGSSANLGGEALQAVASDIEQAATVGELDSAVRRLAELEAQFDRLQVAMRKELGITAG